MFYYHIYRIGSFMEDFPYSVRIHESILMSYFTRYLQSSVKFRQRRKMWEVNSASKLREQKGFTISWNCCLNLCSLRRLRELAVQKFTQIYLRFPVFGKCLKWILQVYFRRSPVGKGSLEVKKIVKVKFLWIIVATAEGFSEWVSVFLEKRKKERLSWVWLWPLSDSTMDFYIYIGQKDDSQFCDITYTSSITESKIF